MPQTRRTISTSSASRRILDLTHCVRIRGTLTSCVGSRFRSSLPKLNPHQFKLREQIKMELSNLKTPSLVLDIEKVRRNAKRMAQRLSGWGVNLRPHVKTHKSVEVARIQTEGHSGAVTVSTLAEARA